MCSDTWMEVDYLEIKVQKVNLSFKGYRMLAKYRKKMSVALKLKIVKLIRKTWMPLSPQQSNKKNNVKLCNSTQNREIK